MLCILLTLIRNVNEHYESYCTLITIIRFHCYLNTFLKEIFFILNLKKI